MKGACLSEPRRSATTPRAFSGDTPELRETAAYDLDRLRRALLAQLQRHGTPRHDAEDAIQDALVRLYLAERVEPIRNPSAFVTTVATRMRIAQWRARQLHNRFFVPELAEAFDVADPAPRLEDVADLAQRLERTCQQLGELRPRTREVFILYRIEGLTCPEVSARLGISVSAIEKHIARAAFALASQRRGGE